MMERPKHPLLTLLLLTLVAGVLRFASLDKPAVWGDEAQTWRRISGSWQQMVDELRIAGFMPGNYVLTWWIKEGFPIYGTFREGPAADRTDPFFRDRGRVSTQRRLVFTPTLRLIEDGLDPSPFVLRFLPALCGTLMVPAMYFLASRLVARRTALLVAVLTCFSAYLLNYSRDAKMYMQFWFFAALHVGCLLWWLQAYLKRPPPPAPAHLADDNVVEGVKSILPETHIARIGDAFTVDPVKPKRPFTGYPTRLETLVRWMCWLTSGFGMIAFNAIGLGIIGLEVLIFLATMPARTHWITHAFRAIRFRSQRKHRPEPKNAPHPSLASSRSNPAQRERLRLILPPVIGFAIGCFAIVALWHGYKDFTRFYDRVNPRDEIARMDLGDAGISWVDEYNDGRTPGGYALYNATSYLMNWEWVKPSQLADVDPTVLKALRWSATALLIAIGLGVVPWRQILSKKPANVSILRGASPATALFIVAAWLLLPAYGFYCASGAWTEDGYEVRAVAPTQLLASAIFPAAANEATNDLAGSLGAELSKAYAAKGWTSHDWAQLFVVHGLDVSSIRWWVLGAVGIALVLMLLERWHTWREKLRLLAGAIGLAALFYALALLVYVFTPVQYGSVWMPRYLGFVWPAFAIAACVLIRRLPTPPLRWVVVGSLIAVNLGVFYHRVTIGEPRTDLMGRDYKAALDSDAIRMFSRSAISRWRGAPGYGTMTTLPGVYYAMLNTRQPTTPAGALSAMRRSLDLDPLSAEVGSGIRVRLARDAKADEFFFWIERRMNEEGVIEDDLRSRLGPEWQPVDAPKTWQVYEHWTWRKIYALERHHWKKAPSTQPATKPTTRRATSNRAR